LTIFEEDSKVGKTYVIKPQRFVDIQNGNRYFDGIGQMGSDGFIIKANTNITNRSFGCAFMMLGYSLAGQAPEVSLFNRR
jgi:hypothetical protein